MRERFCLTFAGPCIDYLKSSRELNEYSLIGSVDMMEGYSFIRNNTAPDALIINWWDYGNDIVYRKNSRYLKNLPNIEWVNIRCVQYFMT